MLANPVTKNHIKQLKQQASVCNCYCTEASQEPLRREYVNRGFVPIANLSLSKKGLANVHDYLKQRNRSGRDKLLTDNGELRAVHGYDGDLVPEFISKLASIATTLIGCESVYMLQFQISSKAPSRSKNDMRKPHRDFDLWEKGDGIKQPRACVFHVFLSENRKENGPLFLCDGANPPFLTKKNTHTHTHNKTGIILLVELIFFI
jgi:hypothetical protein